VEFFIFWGIIFVLFMGKCEVNLVYFENIFWGEGAGTVSSSLNLESVSTPLDRPVKKTDADVLLAIAHEDINFVT
jgi:hypothetical protein